MPAFNLYRADCIGNEWNCNYPHEVIAGDEQSLRRAVDHDYVAVAYQGGYRSKENFLCTNCLALECDNDHSDDESEWVTPGDHHRALPGHHGRVSFFQESHEAKARKDTASQIPCVLSDR